MKRGKYLILLAALLLTGCSILSPIKPTPISTYVLNSIPCHVPYKCPRPITLFVLQPDTRPVYNTTLMAYSCKPYQISYFGVNQWAETPSQMMLPLIVQSLQNTHYFHAVVTSPYTGRYNYLLTTQILQFQQNYVHCPPEFELTVRAQLSRISSNQVVATKLFCVRVPICPRTPYGGVLAANRATSILLSELTEFSLRNAV